MIVAAKFSVIQPSIDHLVHYKAKLSRKPFMFLTRERWKSYPGHSSILNKPSRLTAVKMT